jgi:hypothetical protein
MPKKQMPKNETVQVKKGKNFCKGGGDNNQQTQTDEMLNVETINARVKNIQENLEKLSKTVNDNKTNTNIDSASIAHWVLKLEKEVEKVMGVNPVALSVNKTINGVVYDKIHTQQNKLKPQTSTINTQNKFKQLAQRANINKNMTNNYKPRYVPTLQTIPQVNSQQESVISPNTVTELQNPRVTQTLQSTSKEDNNQKVTVDNSNKANNSDKTNNVGSANPFAPLQGTPFVLTPENPFYKPPQSGGKKKPKVKNPKKK